MLRAVQTSFMSGFIFCLSHYKVFPEFGDIDGLCSLLKSTLQKKKKKKK